MTRRTPTRAVALLIGALIWASAIYLAVRGLVSYP
jgi:hypothetical protein